jgi:hypothetical protein
VGSGWRNQKLWRAETGVESLVDNRARGRGLFRNGVYGSLDGSEPGCNRHQPVALRLQQALPSSPNLTGLR